jgi:hypothetical protein
MLEERKAYYKKNTVEQERIFVIKYIAKISEETTTKELYYKYAGREDYFEKIITAKGVIAYKNEEGKYELNFNI